MSDGKWEVCTSCSAGWAGHTVYQAGRDVQHLCCKCYVRSGGPPSDWHRGCMREVADSRDRGKK
ncbi:MAG: hypothetical protein GY820_39460 [Gammaproteobacteria bacterium]|nr:hypothetical protein [Gammaproteobacteria bacterium]